MKRRFSAQEIAVGALMIAVIETCKMTMQSLPNIELTSFLLILFTLRFGRLCALIVPAFILIEGLIFGFGLWWLMYLYAWPALVLFTLLFAREDSAFFWAVFSSAVTSSISNPAVIIAARKHPEEVAQIPA